MEGGVYRQRAPQFRQSIEAMSQVGWDPNRQLVWGRGHGSRYSVLLWSLSRNNNYNENHSWGAFHAPDSTKAIFYFLQSSQQPFYIPGPQSQYSNPVMSGSKAYALVSTKCSRVGREQGMGPGSW